MNTYRVDVPLTLTVEVECHDPATAKHAIEQVFAPARTSDPLTGHRIALEHDLIIPSVAVIRMAIARGEAEATPA